MDTGPPYLSLEQGASESEDVRERYSGDQEQLKTRFPSGFSLQQEPASKRRVDIVEVVASTAFILTASTCVALAIVFSKKEYISSNLNNNDYISKIDCAVIASDKDYFAGTFLVQVFGGIITSTPDPGTVNQVDRTFMLDLKTNSTLTFLQVKVLDVMWNLIAGQGIRLVMGYITSVVCAYWFATSLTRSTLSYDFYTTVSFQGTTLMSTYETLKQFFHFVFNSRLKKGWGWLIMMLWMVFGMIYTMSIPSLLNASSGYMAPSDPRWQMPNGDLVSDFASTIRACWLVKNDSRIGFDNDTIISGPLLKPFRSELLKAQRNGDSPDRWHEVTTDYPRFDEFTQYYGQIHDILKLTWSAAEENFNLSHANLNFTEKETLLNYSNSLFSKFNTNITINKQKFNISAPPITLGMMPRVLYFIKDGSSNFASFRGIQPCYKDELLSSDFNPPLFCVSNSDTYAWGFSKQVLVGILSTHAVWCVTTWIIWLFVRRASRKLEQRRPGPYLTALVLADSIRGDLDVQLDTLSETKLRKKLGKSDGVKSGRSESIKMDSRVSSRRPFSS